MLAILVCSSIQTFPLYLVRFPSICNNGAELCKALRARVFELVGCRSWSLNLLWTTTKTQFKMHETSKVDTTKTQFKSHKTSKVGIRLVWTVSSQLNIQRQTISKLYCVKFIGWVNIKWSEFTKKQFMIFYTKWVTWEQVLLNMVEHKHSLYSLQKVTPISVSCTTLQTWKTLFFFLDLIFLQSFEAKMEKMQPFCS